MKKDEFLKRCLQMVDVAGGISKAANLADVSMPTIRRWLDGEVEPRLSSLANLASALNVSLDWVYFGEESNEIKPEIILSKDAKLCSDFEFIKGYNVQASAGHGVLNNNEEPTRYLAFRKKWLRFKNLSPNNLVIIFVKGDSMQPTIYDNDTILINLAQKNLIDGFIYVLRQGEDLLVKRIQKLPNGVRLISDNKFYDKVDILGSELESFEIIGQVVHVSHDL